VFRLHVGLFVLYNGLIGYTMALRLRTGVLFGVLFAAAMALHFVVVDRGLEEHYRERFEWTGRYILAASLPAGWLPAWLRAPTGPATSPADSQAELRVGGA
jgi:hypothetical protein